MDSLPSGMKETTTSLWIGLGGAPVLNEDLKAGGMEVKSCSKDRGTDLWPQLEFLEMDPEPQLIKIQLEKIES